MREAGKRVWLQHRPDIPLNVLYIPDGIDARGTSDAGSPGLLSRMVSHLTEMLPDELFCGPVGECQMKPLRSKGETQTAISLSYDLSKHDRHEPNNPQPKPPKNKTSRFREAKQHLDEMIFWEINITHPILFTKP